MATPELPVSNIAAKEVNPWIIAISVMLAAFMEVLDTTVVNVSLPHIAGNLSASIDEATGLLLPTWSRTPSFFR
jgi:hypothetical protein